MRRFINADAFASTGQGSLGFNMFAYCQNNPVMYVDPSGNVVSSWDLAYLSSDDLKEVTRATYNWGLANMLGLESKANEQHRICTEIRNRYLSSGQTIAENGYVLDEEGNYAGAYVFFIDGTKYIINYSVMVGNIRIPSRNNNVDELVSLNSGIDAFITHIQTDYQFIIGTPCRDRSLNGMKAEFLAHYYPDGLFQKYPLFKALAERTEFIDLDNADWSGKKNYYIFEISFEYLHPINRNGVIVSPRR